VGSLAGWNQAKPVGEIAQSFDDIAAEVAAAVAGTRLYLPADELPAPRTSAAMPAVEVTNESTWSRDTQACAAMSYRATVVS
jgi:hypothetical protein